MKGMMGSPRTAGDGDELHAVTGGQVLQRAGS